MALSRKRKKELKRLLNAASDLWGDQKDLVDHAGHVAREAGRQASYLSREEVAPRIRDAYRQNLRPTLSTGVAAGRSFADSTRNSINKNVVPSVSSALSSAAAMLEVSKDPRVQEALSRVREAGERVGTRVGVVPAKKTAGPGRYILKGIAVVAAAGIAYAAWQTLRADDELWVNDNDDTEVIGTESAAI